MEYSRLTNLELDGYAKRLGIENSSGVYMRDVLPKIPHHKECGIVNFNTSYQQGSHLVCYFKDGMNRIYFGSFGQVTPMEIQMYLKTRGEYDAEKVAIQRNTDIVQHSNTHVCGHLYVYLFIC